MSFITKKSYCSPEVMKYLSLRHIKLTSLLDLQISDIRDGCGFIGMLSYHLLIDAAIDTLKITTLQAVYTSVLCVCV